MKRSGSILIFLLPLLILGFLIPDLAPCTAPRPEKEAAAKAVNAFAIDLYGQIRKPEGNLIFSPYSISMCLAMAYAGARGKTEAQMAKALHFSLGQPKVSEEFGTLNARILSAGQGKGAELNVANGLWAEKSYTFRKEFLESIRTDHAKFRLSQVPLLGALLQLVSFNSQSGLQQLDFRHDPESARNTINKWVEDQTRDKIKDLFPPKSINKDTRLVLPNAIYFKGIWESQFKERWTREEPFTLLGGKDVKVPMMSQTQSFGYAEETDLQVLQMPYKGGELAMVVLLPSKQKRFEDFEGSLTFEKLSQRVGKLGTRKVEVYLPRFRMISEFSLRSALTKLGMTDAFSLKAADFSGMTGDKDIFIEDGYHKAFVETNEEGTEAAAATGFSIRRTGAPAPAPVFRADHPFLFLIVHRPSNCILFLGRVTNP